LKPYSEGTSIGVTQASVVHGPAELRAQVERILAEHRQPALGEEFIGGTEYTIGVVGDCVLPILELDLSTSRAGRSSATRTSRRWTHPSSRPCRSTRILTGTARSP
jgi:hypothetical protein